MAGRIFSLVVSMLPQHGISRVVHALARWRWRPWKNLLIRIFSRVYAVDRGEAAASESHAYVSFNDFFTRALAPGVRPIDGTLDAVISPVDGSISEFGTITAGRLIQAKGQDYGVTELLGGDEALARPFTDGRFATLYLSPRDYHRIHMPMAGSLARMLHVPGRLFGVSRPLVQQVPRLFARNERVVSVFDSAMGPMAVVLVGAIGVGSIETVWAGEITPPRGQRIRSWDYRQNPVSLRMGEELGRFNLGSTVILLFADPQVAWRDDLAVDQPIRMGERLGGRVRAIESGTVPGERHHTGQ